MADAPPHSRNRLDSLGATRENAFPAALRHTARVSKLKRGILWSLVIGLALGGLFAAFQLLRLLPLDLRFAHIALKGSRITIQTPKIVGYRKDGRPYELRAKVGVQDITSPDVFELEGVDVRYEGGADSSVKLTAETGVYDGKQDRAQLAGHVRIYDGKSFDLNLERATMDFKAATLTSDRRATLALDGMQISANSVEFTQPDSRATFVGETHTVVYGEKADDAADKSQGDLRKD